MGGRSWRSKEVVVAGLAGIAVGALVAKWDRFSDWLLNTNWDWSSLPAVLVGTAIPATAGFLLADRLAERNTRELRLAQLEAERSFADAEDAREMAAIESRRSRWDEIRAAADTLDELLGQHDPQSVGSPEVQLALEDHLESTNDKRRFATYIDRQFTFPAQLRCGLPDLRTAVDSQLVEGGVVRLVPVSEALERLDRYCAADLWPQPTEESVVAGYREWSDIPYERDLAPPVRRCIQMLRSIADRERSAVPGLDFYSHLEWNGWPGSDSQSVDVPQEFARLRDAVDRVLVAATANKP